MGNQNATALALESTLDFIVRMNRAVKPTNYPQHMKRVVHLALETTGSMEYDLSRLGLWLHDNQQNGTIRGQVIFDYLMKKDSFTAYLNLQDGNAIKAKGIEVFRVLFAGKALFLWGSVVEMNDHSFSVPYLCDDGSQVVLSWMPLNYPFDKYSVAPFHHFR